MQKHENEHTDTVAGFGNEWARFDQSGAQETELESTFAKYFAIFPWSRLAPFAAHLVAYCGRYGFAKRLTSSRRLRMS